MPDKTILLDHGSGGRLSRDLIDSLFVKYFDNPALNRRTDAALLPALTGRPALTTDSYVITPHIFPGGDIGALAVCGTINDLAVSGATPLALTAGFILEAGFEFSTLETIVSSMARTAREAGVAIVTGDTKVVERGQCDGVYINTAGLGEISPAREAIGAASEARPGDAVIVSGPIADHGMAVMAARNEFPVQGDLRSDCAPLHRMIRALLDNAPGVSFMRDATRGGLGAVLCELAAMTGLGVAIHENRIPINDSVAHVCELFGFDPLFVANEGKIVATAPREQAQQALAALHAHPCGARAAIIGALTSDHPGAVHMKTGIGGSRIIDTPAGAQLPRIC